MIKELHLLRDGERFGSVIRQQPVLTNTVLQPKLIHEKVLNQ